MKKFLKYMAGHDVVSVVLALGLVSIGLAGSCHSKPDNAAVKSLENAARMYEVEAAELRGYSQALRDTGEAPRPKGGAK